MFTVKIQLSIRGGVIRLCVLKIINNGTEMRQSYP